MTSCVSRRKNYYKPAEECFEKIIEALENKDSEGLKAMFSATALKEAEDIDTGIEYIMDLYKGEFKSISRNSPGAQSSRSYGTITYEMVTGSYTFETSEDTYRLTFGNLTVDADSNNVGLMGLVIVREEEYKKYFDEYTKVRYGVYYPGKTIEE